MIHIFENVYIDLIIVWAVIVLAVVVHFVDKAHDDIGGGQQ